MKSSVLRIALATVAAFCTSGIASAAWEPVRPVEFIVPAGTGGGADQMARFIQGVAAKNNLMKQPIVVVNKSGGAGAEGFLDVKGDKGNPHKIIITLSNLFTTPLATGADISFGSSTRKRCAADAGTRSNTSSASISSRMISRALSEAVRYMVS